MVALGPRSYTYSISPDDVIRWVDRNWLAFAKENGAPELTLENVLDRSLWDFISGEPTQAFYRAIVRRVRETNHTFVIPFRCDSPRLRRYLRLEIHPVDSGAIRFKSVLQRVEPCVFRSLLAQSVSTSADAVDICSCCKRVYLRPWGWLELEEAAARLPGLESGEVPQLRQVICPICPTHVEIG